MSNEDFHFPYIIGKKQCGGIANWVTVFKNGPSKIL